MTDKLQAVRGTKDLLPANFRAHEYIIEVAKKNATLYGYEAMSTPIIEYSKVFNRTLGDSSDVVSKEMYSFLDKSNDEIALRPEFTAGIMRSFISNGLHHTLPLKFFSYGPVFRYDRPQSGRQRQFHQFNFEHLGGSGACTDAEIIKLAADILTDCGLNEEVELQINSLGCTESKKVYQEKIFTYFSQHQDKLSTDSIQRLTKNPLRILDSKDEQDKQIAQLAPLVADSYTREAQKYFEEVLTYLDLLKVKYTINPRLVRGLDYYCHTAFEFIAPKLGSQSTLIGGGRYDGLSTIMGGPAVAAVGFAGGIERFALMRDYNILRTRSVVVVPIGEESINASLSLANELRQNKIPTVVKIEGKVDKRLQYALNIAAKYIIFIGEEEILSNKYKIKDLDKHQESLLGFEEIVKLINASQL